VLRVPTNDGVLWFKAAVPSLSHDVGVTSTLAQLRPDLVLAPLAAEFERRWMLLPAAGERLREVLVRERHTGRWVELAPLYAQLQMASASCVGELLDYGTPDYRLARLPDLSGQLALALGLSPPSARLVTALAAELEALCLPETIQHDDLHDDNVFVRTEGGYAIVDWGDSCISHPFVTLSVLLDGTVPSSRSAPLGDSVKRIQDAYLECWGEPEQLCRAAKIAVCFGKLTRALVGWRWGADVAEPGRYKPTARAISYYEEFERAVRECAR
jgi:hypothetical protein